jgi:hypothetical protein
MLEPFPTPIELPLPPWLPPPPEPPPPAPCAQLRLVTLTEINRDRREVKIVFTISFDEYNYRNLQRLSPALQNVLMSAKLEPLASLDARELLITVAPARWGSPMLYLSPLRVYQGYLLRIFSAGFRLEQRGGSLSRRRGESMLSTSQPFRVTCNNYRHSYAQSPGHAFAKAAPRDDRVGKAR